jgi:hypothetical protein
LALLGHSQQVQPAVDEQLDRPVEVGLLRRQIELFGKHVLPALR